MIGVAYSYVKTNRNSWPYMKDCFVRSFKVEFIKRRNKVNYVFVRYEDFVRDPRKALVKILSRVNFDFEKQMLKFRVIKHHQPAVNLNVRFCKEEEDLKYDNSWKSNLNFKTKFIFNFLFGWLNWYYKIKK